MRRDVETTGSRRQVQLPLHLQIAFRQRREAAGGYSFAIVRNPIELDHSRHEFPAPCLAFYAITDARENAMSNRDAQLAL
jgi:hypothetical protein